MKVEDLSSFSEASDSEGCVEDLNDGDNFYDSADIPKLQFRTDVSRARWIDDLQMAEAVVRKGQMWRTTGIVRGGKIYCSIEETLFLAEIGALHLLDDNDTPYRLKDIYSKILEHKSGCSWESFEAYKHLKSLGYVVGRHDVPWSMKGIVLRSPAEESFQITNFESRGSFDITKMLNSLEIDEVKPMFDVYYPNSKFKKSCPGCPSFLLCLKRGWPPSKQEFEELQRRFCGSALKFCHVDHGRVSFFSIDCVELPILA